MILSKNIPGEVQLFLNRLYQDREAKLYAKDYRAFLIQQTNRRYPGLIRGLSRTGRTRQGLQRVLADADHIVPVSLWDTLMPLLWNLPGKVPSVNTLSNLFWRTVANNRGSEKRGEAFDQPYIRDCQREAALYGKKTVAAVHWAWAKVDHFLQTKRIEGVNVDVPWQPGKLDELRDAADVSAVVAFVQKLRESNPGIRPERIAALVEEAFPFIQIEMTSRGPIVEIG